MGVGVFGSFNQVSLRGLLGYSSVHHGGWILMGLIVSDYLWFLYFLLYSILMVRVIVILKELGVQDFKGIIIGRKKSLIFLVLSVGGIPPFLGFVLK